MYERAREPDIEGDGDQMTGERKIRTAPKVFSRICSASVSSTLASLNFCWSLCRQLGHTAGYDAHLTKVTDSPKHTPVIPQIPDMYGPINIPYPRTGRLGREYSAWSQRQDARAQMPSQGPPTPACRAEPQPHSAPVISSVHHVIAGRFEILLRVTLGNSHRPYDGRLFSNTAVNKEASVSPMYIINTLDSPGMRTV
jgi:hypothetical protein